MFKNSIFLRDREKPTMIQDFNPIDPILQQLEDLESDFPDLVVTKGQFVMGSVIGKGGFGEVYRARDRVSQRDCAYKQIFSERLEGNRMRRYIAEIKTMASCDNMFLVPLVGFTAEAPYSIVTEFMPRGSLDKYIRKRHPDDVCPLSGTQLTSIAIGISHGMIHLHNKGIIHRDLKAANILLDQRYFPRICDFGIARFEDIAGGMTQKIGTPNYMAPELIVSNSYDNKVDVYAFAMILYEMAEGVRAFKGMKLNDIFNSVVKNQNRPEFTQATPEPLQELIAQCWDQDPKERPTFEEIFDAFYQGYVAFPDSKIKEIRKFCKLIQKDEEKRGPIREQHERELRERQLARQNGIKVDPRKKAEPIQVSDYYDDDDYEYDEVVVDNKVISPINEKHSRQSNSVDLRSLANIKSPNFESNLNHVISTLQPKQVGSFVQVISPHFIKRASVHILKLIIHGVIKLMNKSDLYVNEILKTQFFSLLPVNKDALVNDCVECYRILFEQYQDNLTDIHIPNIAELLQQRPTTMLCLFSSYITISTRIDNSLVDLLYQIPKLIMNTPDGKLLLSIFYYLMDTNPSYAKSNRSRILSIFSLFLKSTDPGTSVSAIWGLVHLHGKIDEKDIPFIEKSLHDGIMWTHAVRYLAECKNIPASDEIIRGLIFRAKTSKLALLVLLKIASTKSGASVFLRYPQWMVLSEERPREAFQIFLVLFKNKSNRRTLAASEQFPYFLKNIVKINDDFHINSIPSILKRASLNPRLIKDLTSSGFIAKFLEVVSAKNDPMLFKHLLVATDMMARTDYSDEYLRIAQVLMSIMNDPTILNYCLSVFITLSYYKQCAYLFYRSGILNYIEQYKKFPQYVNDVNKFIDKVRSYNFK